MAAGQRRARRLSTPPDSLVHGALGHGRLGWLLGLSVVAIASQGLMAVMGMTVGPSLGFGGSPAGMVALLLGLLLDGVLWILAIKVAVEALLDGLAGPQARAREHLVADGLAVRHLVLWLLLGLAALVVWRVGGDGGLGLFALATLLVLPAVLALLTLDDSLLHAFDPRAWFELWRRAGPSYLACAALLAAVFVGALVAGWLLGWVVTGWLAAALLRFLQWTALVLGYHALGRWLHRRREAFDIAPAPSLPRARLGSFDEDAAMQEANALAATDPAAAAARLLPVLRGRGGSPPVHARYRELLLAADDRVALHAHDREYVATLLALGQERPALALYLAARAVDPAFELEEPAELGQLIVLTERIGQLQLSVTLAAEYERRFPRTRDAVAHGLRAARLLASRLDRVGDARTLLQAMLAARADHEQRGELEQALAALPRA